MLIYNRAKSSGLKIKNELKDNLKKKEKVRLSGLTGAEFTLVGVKTFCKKIYLL